MAGKDLLKPTFNMSSDEADALVTSTDPLHVCLCYETCTHSEFSSVDSPRISSQSSVLGFIDLGGSPELEVGSVSAWGRSFSTLNI